MSSITASRIYEGIRLRVSEGAGPVHFYLFTHSGDWLFSDHKPNSGWLSVSAEGVGRDLQEKVRAVLEVERAESVATPFLSLEQAAARWPDHDARWRDFRRGGRQWTEDTVFRVLSHPGLQQLPKRLMTQLSSVEAVVKNSIEQFGAIRPGAITPQAKGVIQRLVQKKADYDRAAPSWGKIQTLYSLLNDCDTTCACLAVCDDVQQEEMDDIRSVWRNVQDKKVALLPSSAYAEAVFEVRQLGTHEEGSSVTP